MRRTVLPALILVAAAFSGCRTDVTVERSALAARSVPDAVNDLCPIGREPIEASGGLANWNGMQVGFCCAPCRNAFDALSDAEKRARLEGVGVTFDGP